MPSHPQCVVQANAEREAVRNPQTLSSPGRVAGRVETQTALPVGKANDFSLGERSEI